MQCSCRYILLAVFFMASHPLLRAQEAWKQGIVKNEFIYLQAPFPQCHASTVAATPRGLVAAWFGGSNEGNRDVCIYTSHYINNRWAAPVKAADGIINDTLRYACYNPVLYQVPGGELLLFYKIGPNVAGWTGWMKRSADNGHSWQKPERLPAGFLGPIKNKPLLVNGQLICPSSTETNGWTVHFEYTPDQGRSWTKSAAVNDGLVSIIQPAICTYPGGGLQAVCRSQQGHIYACWSHDGGIHWDSVAATSLPNNNSGLDAVTLKDGRQLLVYNHVPPDSGSAEGRGPRTPLNVALSKDGKNWYAALVLEDAPALEFSYPSVIQAADGMVHIVYTWHRQRIKHIIVDPSKLHLQPISEGQWPVYRPLTRDAGSKELSQKKNRGPYL